MPEETENHETEPPKSTEPPKPGTHVVLSVALVNAVLQYLDTRPHREVRGLIDEIQKGRVIALDDT